ncbi:MAG: peptidoglycan endopeptidase [Treponema sp.]|nr:peptidoglycan endopeptidase [Treponema sp.]
MKLPKAAFLFFILLVSMSPPGGADPNEESNLTAFSDPRRIWGNGIERIIEEAYRQFFHTRIIAGRVMNIRMPFAQEYERNILSEYPWRFYGNGKAGPQVLWAQINEIMDSDDFRAYIEALSDGREKVIIFDMPTQSWSQSRDLFEIARMRTGSYLGLLHRPYVLNLGRGPQESDIYNYLYCVGLVGLDCSAFVWHMLDYVAAAGGLDLGRIMAPSLGIRSGENAAMLAGTSFFNSRSSQIIPVQDEIRNLRPGDILLFRAEDGGMSHSALIQSVNFTTGVIRYVQCTDEAPLSERGVHDSYIYFDPANPRVSLSDPSLEWTQRRYPPFPGEQASPFSDDGLRYRAFPQHGGGRVVRIRVIMELVARMGW